MAAVLIGRFGLGVKSGLTGCIRVQPLDIVYEFDVCPDEVAAGRNIRIRTSPPDPPYP